MSKASEAFDSYAEDYDKWFDSPEGRVLFETEVGAVRSLMKGLEHQSVSAQGGLQRNWESISA
ncbi:MAG: hypothetical protein M1508_06440 [Nitrospirae bacterium]|nr:hypothetical protein [Nitrospirota bacterium]